MLGGVEGFASLGRFPCFGVSTVSRKRVPSETALYTAEVTSLALTLSLTFLLPFTCSSGREPFPWLVLGVLPELSES